MAITLVDGFNITNASPIDSRLVFTSSRVLFVSSSTSWLPASQRYIGMEVYIVPNTCSYTLARGTPRAGGGIDNAVWYTGSVTSSYAKSSSFASKYTLFQITASTVFYATASFSSSWSSMSLWADFAGTASSSTYANTANKITVSPTITPSTYYVLLGENSSSYSESIVTALGLWYQQGTGVLNTTSSQAVSASWVLSASWAPGGGGTGLDTGSTYPFTASHAISASWAPGQAPGSGLATGSTYPFTSSHAESASFAVSASWAPGGSGTGLDTGSTYPFTASHAESSSVSVSSSYAQSSSFSVAAITASLILSTASSHRFLSTKHFVAGYKPVTLLNNTYTNVLTVNLSGSNNATVRTSLHGLHESSGSVLHTSEYMVSRGGIVSETIDGYILNETTFPYEDKRILSRIYYDDNPNNIFLQYSIPTSTLTGSFTYEVRGLFNDVDKLIPPFGISDPTEGSRSLVDTGFYSPFEFQTISPRNITTDAVGTPWSASQTMSYNQMFAHCVSMSVLYPTRVSLDSSLTSSDGGFIIPVLKIDDDGYKPVVTIYHGVHGTERVASQGLFKFLYDYLDATITDDPIYNDARNRLTLLIFPVVQPWGWQNNSRENANGVDINRNCKYGWEQTLDPDKGSEPNSEENRTIRNYMYTSSYYQRQLATYDSHGWGYYGQWWFGYLVGQMWYTPHVIRAQRSCFLYSNRLLDSRLTTSFYTSNSLWYGLRGNDGMRAVETRGALKPYVNNNGLEWTNPNCFRILMEHPQYFNGGASATGSLGESASVCSIQKYDTFQGLLACASEYYSMLSESVASYYDCPAMQPANSNSVLQDWNLSAARPDWTFYNKVQLSQIWDTASNAYFVRVVFPSSVAAPSLFSEAGYLTMSYADIPRFVVIGGNGASSTYNNTSFTENLSNISQSIISSTPVGKSCVIVTDHSSSLWRIGGFYTGSTYLNSIWRANIADVFSGSSITWEVAASMSYGNQRHTAHYWVNPNDLSAYIIVAGGRHSDSYTASIYKYRVDDNSYTETTMSTVLTTPRAWHVSAISASTLFVWGGYNGFTTYAGTQKIDLVNDTSSAGTNLPASRKQMAIAVDPDIPNDAYLVWGNTGTADATGSIFKYNMSTGVVTNVPYIVDFGGEENSSSVNPDDIATMSPATAIHDGVLYIYGGERPTGSYHDDIYSMDLTDLIMSNRLTATDANYGYFKVSNHSGTNVFSGSTKGDVFTAVTRIRRSSGSYFNGSTDPYIRFVWKSGPNSYIPLRKNQSGKFVPTTDWQVFSFPFVLTSSLETQIQGPYIRTYVPGQSYDISSFQVFKGSLGKINRIVAQAGEAALVCSRSFMIALESSHSVEKTVRFEPYFGSNSSTDVDLIRFNFSGSSQVTNMVLHYSASLTSSRPSVSKDYATWYDSVPTGQYDLRWMSGSAAFTHSFLLNAEVNHASDRFEGYRLDSVSLRFNTTASQASAFTASMWFKGRTEHAYITKSIVMSGFQTLGVGMLLYEDVA